MGNLKQSLREQAVKVYLNGLYPIVLRHRAKQIGKKDKIEVVFFAMNLAMWRYQGVYELLSQDERFNCHIVFTVPSTFTEEQKAADLQQLRVFFDSKGIQYIDHDLSSRDGFDVKKLIDPDIIFYPQPYAYTYPQNHAYGLFKSKLWCYVTYSINVVKGNTWLYDLKFHNLAWKIYCPTALEKDSASEIARNHGRNWVVAGYANLDKYCSDECVDVWKIKDKAVKRLIWAPHFTLSQDTTWMFSRSSFLWMCEKMLDLADRYCDKLQIAFKPHPRLKSELYKHPDWGKEKTDAYYKRWADGINTQLETGDFVDLFKSSDAMIHDCGSFTAEYLYVNKPVAFVTSDFENLMKDHNAFGQEALKRHYIVSNEDEARVFIEKVVLNGLDAKAAERTDFFNTVLKQNVNGSTSEFIVDDMKRSLGLH